MKSNVDFKATCTARMYRVMQRIVFRIAEGLLILALNACNLSTQTEGPRTWIDQPLKGTHLSLTALTIQAHASDEDGVAEIEFFVSEELIQEVSTGGQRLGDASIEWTPTNPGSYIIIVQAVDNQGNMGSPASVQIVVDGEFPETATPTDVTDFPQCESESLIAPVLLSPADGSTVEPDPLLAWSYPDADCHPQSYRIDISEDASFSDISWGFGTLGYNETIRQWSLPPGVCYYWRAMAYVPDVNGPASPAWSFCIEETAGPTFTLSQNANCRSGPGTAYDAKETLMKGQTVSIVGRNADNTWLLVRKPSGSLNCWVSIITGQIAGNLDEVQVVNVAPLTEPPTEASVDDTPPDITDIHVDPSSIQVEGCGEPSTALVGANVTDEGGVSRAIARIPGYGEIELAPTDGGVYEAALGPFSETGEYAVFILAWDAVGNGAQAAPVTITVVCIG